jgi:DNA-binding MarR family transcriptional regulator
MRANMAEQPLIRLVPVAGKVVSQHFGRIFGRQSGLSPAGAAILTILTWGSGGILERGEPGRATPADLARRSLISPATVTGIVDTLEKAGYVTRQRDTADRRITWVVVTDAGRERATEIGQQTRELLNTTSAERDPAKAAIVREFLMELIINYHEKE